MQLTGTWLDIFIVFTAGLLVSFTPCVYPVLPMTAAFIAGANPEGSQRRAFSISLVYVLGMAIVYALLAVIAALTGKIFGQLQNSFTIYLIIGILLVLFAALMVDLIQWPFFQLSSTVKTIKPKNYLAVLVAGMTAGLVVGPCTAPILGSLLVLISSKQNIWYGVLLMFIFAYGVGFSLILIGTFSGLLRLLPKSGNWLKYIKWLSGLLLLGLGVVFLVKAWHLFLS